MTFIAWSMLGLIAGISASKTVNSTGGIVLHDIVLGIVGAVDGGYLFQLTFGIRSATRMDYYSIVGALAGAVAILYSYHALVRHVKKYQ